MGWYQRRVHGNRDLILCGSLLGLVFWNSIHLEVAWDPFCLLCNCPWLLVFALCLFFMILSGFNLYCWKGIHFPWSNSLIFLLLFLGLIFCFHFLGIFSFIIFSNFRDLAGRRFLSSRSL